MLGRFVRFCIVGGSGVFVDMGVLYLMSDRNGLGLSVIFGKLCAGSIAMVNNFMWNEIWTFSGTASVNLGVADTSADREQGRGTALLQRFLMFALISGTGVLVATALLYLVHTALHWNLYLGNLAVVTVVALWNFGMNARFNWKIVS